MAPSGHKLPLATKKILRRERPVYPKTGQSHPKKCATYGRSSLFAVITTTKYNNFALLISFHLVLQAHYA